MPVAAGGLDFDRATHAALAPTTLNDFRSWSIARVHDDPIGDIEAAAIARRVLTRRVDALHAASPDEAPLVVDVYTRRPVARRADAALTVDLTHRFNGRHASAEAWQTTILPAFDAIVEVLGGHASGRPIQLRGLASLSAAVALGTTLLAPRRMPAAWMQYTAGRPDTPYSLASQRQPSGFSVTLRDQIPGAKDLAVLVNINENTVPAIQATVGLPEFRGWVEANPPGVNPSGPNSDDAYRHLFPGPGEAVDLAHSVVDGIRSARSRYGRIGDVHLFLAAPAGFAFLLGQLLNTLGTVHTYDVAGEDGVGHYRRAATIRLSK